MCANCPSKIPLNSRLWLGWHHSFLDHSRHVAAWSIRFRLNYSHRYTAMIFNYFHFYRVNLLFISNVFFFQAFQKELFWGRANQAQKFVHYPTRYYSTTRLWGHYPTLPYSKLKKHYSLGPGQDRFYDIQWHSNTIDPWVQLQVIKLWRSSYRTRKSPNRPCGPI